MEETRDNRKRKFRKHHAFLLAETFFCLLAIWWEVKPGDIFEASFTFPFAQLGVFLRALSLSGDVGNAAATLLYGMLCLLPAGYLLWRLVKRRAEREDCLLLLLAALMFAGLYLFINPALFERMTVMEGMAVAGKWAVTAGIYAVLTGYAVLRLLNSYEKKKGEVIGQLTFLLKCAEAVVVFSFVFLQTAETLAGLETMREKNTGAASQMLFLTSLILCLRLFVKGVSSLMILLVLERGIFFLEALSADRYGAQARGREKSYMISAALQFFYRCSPVWE